MTAQHMSTENFHQKLLLSPWQLYIFIINDYQACDDLIFSSEITTGHVENSSAMTTLPLTTELNTLISIGKNYSSLAG
jgi:hypothetical protein